MKILFVHEVSYQHKVVFEMHEFPEYFSILGDDISFFEFPEFAPRWPKFSKSEQKWVAGRVISDASIELITPASWGKGIFNRVLAPMMNFPSLWRTIRDGQFDAIVLYAVPTTGWQTLMIARHFDVPVVFRALDVSHKIRNTIFSELVKAAEKFIYRNANLLSGNNPALVEYCIRLSNRTGPSVVHVPPLDLEHFESPQVKMLRTDLNLPEDAQVVVYMGTFFDFANLNVVIEKFAELAELHPRLHLLLVGGGGVDVKLRAQVAGLGVKDRVIFTGIVDYLDLPAYLHLADVAINPFSVELLTHVALPNKILQYIAANLPVVSTALDGIRELLGGNSGVTWVLSPEQVLPEAVRLLNSSQVERSLIIKLQKESVSEKFKAETATNKFHETIQQLVDANRRAAIS